jgi:hypothetical protein
LIGLGDLIGNFSNLLLVFDDRFIELTIYFGNSLFVVGDAGKEVFAVDCFVII